MDVGDISMGYLVAQALDTPSKSYEEGHKRVEEKQKVAVKTGMPIVTASQVPPPPKWPERQIVKEV